MAKNYPRKQKKLGVRAAVEAAYDGTDPSTAKSAAEEEGVPEATQVQHWVMELQDSDRFLEKWHNQGDRTVRRYLDDMDETNPATPTSRLNLFYSNVVTLKSILYAKLPKVEADRRFLDPNDDVARVASEMVTRMLQNDLNSEDNTLDSVLKNALQDRLVPGYGGARVKYCMEETTEGDGDEATSTKKDEWCEEVYQHWKDVRWSPCRTAEEVRWKAYRAYMTKEEVSARFGADVARLIPYASTGPELSPEKRATTTTPVADRKQAEVWEIWNKPDRKVRWVVKGYGKFLDTQEDPLELREFFPDASPMVANTSTTRYLPKPDYAFAHDLYTEIDELETRIRLLTSAARCVGVYDKTAKEVARIFTDGVENQLLPVDNWAMFAEKGGLKGVMDWVPLDAIVNAIATLSQQQQGRIQQLYQVTGMSDILRGQATAAGATATEQKIKAQFGSTRIQAIQEEFAKFAQDLLQKKVQLIQRFYDPQRIIELSNVLNTDDAALAEQAIALIKSPASFNCRIAIRSESMAQVDYDSLKMERTEFLQGFSQFLGQATPLIQMQPETAPWLLKILRFTMAAFKGGNEIEGVVDQFAAAIENKIQQASQQPPKPSPEEMKAQAEMQKMQAQLQIDQQKAQMDMQGKQADLEMKRQEMELEREKMQMELQFKREEMALKREQMQMDMALKGRQAHQQMQIDQAKADTQLTLESQKASNAMEMEQANFEQQQAQNEATHKATMKQSAASAKQDQQLKAKAAKTTDDGDK